MPTNRRLVDFEGPDYYPTPQWATRALLANERFDGGSISEPCAGEHHIADVLEAEGYRPSCSDIIDYGFGDRICDFREVGPFDYYVTNPPFKLAEAFVDYCLQHCKRKFALLLRLSFLESQGRFRKYYDNRLLARCYIFSERLSLFPGGIKGDLNDGTTAHGWFVFDRERSNYHPEIRFLRPGFKPKGCNGSARA